MAGRPHCPQPYDGGLGALGRYAGRITINTGQRGTTFGVNPTGLDAPPGSQHVRSNTSSLAGRGPAVGSPSFDFCVRRGYTAQGTQDSSPARRDLCWDFWLTDSPTSPMMINYSVNLESAQVFRVPLRVLQRSEQD